MIPKRILMMNGAHVSLKKTCIADSFASPYASATEPFLPHHAEGRSRFDSLK